MCNPTLHVRLYAPILSTTYARDCGTILIVEAMIVITIIPRKTHNTIATIPSIIFPSLFFYFFNN